ncbi:hypothetical protein R3P38DRAFT_3451272 [Favolaschia claudopus]|uniref:Uncharacterized protein n=1 Tax=Favolaschia claudopus TaxID=2862362 RepID=A0AAV9ZLB9_9AGAR
MSGVGVPGQRLKARFVSKRERGISRSFSLGGIFVSGNFAALWSLALPVYFTATALEFSPALKYTQRHLTYPSTRLVGTAGSESTRRITVRLRTTPKPASVPAENADSGSAGVGQSLEIELGIGIDRSRRRSDRERGYATMTAARTFARNTAFPDENAGREEVASRVQGKRDCGMRQIRKKNIENRCEMKKYSAKKGFGDVRARLGRWNGRHDLPNHS